MHCVYLNALLVVWLILRRKCTHFLSPSMQWMLITPLQSVQICLSILNPYTPPTNGLSHENTQRTFHIFYYWQVFALRCEMLFCCQPIPLPWAYICGDSSQLNTAANDTYQNNAWEKLAEIEKVGAKSFISACDVDRMRQG